MPKMLIWWLQLVGMAWLGRAVHKLGTSTDLHAAIWQEFLTPFGKFYVWSILRSIGATIIFHLSCSFLLGIKICKVQQPTNTQKMKILVFIKMIYLIKKRYIDAGINILSIVIENFAYYVVWL